MARGGRAVGMLVEAFDAWRIAPHGCKSSVLERYARPLGVTTTRQLRRLFESHGLVERAERPQLRESDRYPLRRIWAESVAQYKHTPPKRQGSLITEQAVALALENNALPPEAADVPLRTWDRWLADFDLRRRESASGGRARRFRAKMPNEAWGMDASRSNHFAVVRRLDDGDFLLRFQSSGIGPYKNKEERATRLRVWVYQAVDDHSSCSVCRYTVAQGESSLDALDFLSWAMAGADRERLYPYGRPQNLVLDNGPIKKRLKANDAFMRCGIGLPGREPYNKRGGGKVERPFRTLWARFEKSFWPRAQVEGGLELRLSELNALLCNYLADYNEWAHPTFRAQTRRSAWLKILHTGLVELPQDALYTGFQQWEKKVSIDGVIRHGGREWIVIGAQACEGHLFEDLNGVLTFRDERGYGHRVVPFQEAPFGEYRAQPTPPAEKLPLPENVASITPYQRTAENGGLRVMKPRTAATVEPLRPWTEAERFASAADAMKDFLARIGGDAWRTITTDDPETAQEIIRLVTADLSRDTVARLADRLNSAQGEAHGTSN